MKNAAFYLLFFLCFLAVLPLKAQPKKYTISGYLTDTLTTETLIGASVYDRASRNGVAANQYGFYSLTLAAGQVDLLFAYMGYSSASAKFLLTQDTLINIKLSASMTSLDSVVVYAESSEHIQRKTQMSVVSIPVAQLKALPALLGEVDVLKGLQLTPGVQSGGEGTSGIYVRGGGPDQNLMLLDGVPVYNASHLFGFFSVFNADAINNVELMKGGFPARYGGRTSSVVDISMKEGNAQKFHGEGSIGLIFSKLMLEGPIWKDRTSFIVSARRTYIDVLTKPIIKAAAGNDYNPSYYFYDLTAKVNHKFSDRDRVFVSAYLGKDNFGFANKSSKDTEGSNYDHYESESGLNWGNLTAALRWNRIFTNKLFANFSATYSRFNFNIFASDTQDAMMNGTRSYSSFHMKYLSGIEDWAGKVNFEYTPSPNHNVRFGVHGIYHTFSPGAMGVKSQNDSEVPDLDTVAGASSLHAGSFSAYAEDDMHLGDKLKVNVGLHWSGFAVSGKFYHHLQPRIAARYLINDDLSVKASYSRMAQYIHLLTNSGISLPTDLWVPSTAKLKPQASDQVAVGAAYSRDKMYELSLEAYYKNMSNVLEYREGGSFFEDNTEWENKIVQGEGRSYGVELFLQKKTGTFTGWVGYTLSWTKRRFDELNFGEWFDYKYDRRHDLSVVAMYKLSKTVELSGTWVYGTGNAITLPIATYPSQNPLSISPFSRYDVTSIYSRRNEYRMASYHRLDFSVSFVKQKRWGERRWTIGLYNAYSRKNPFFIDLESEYNWNATGNFSTKYKYVQYSLFPIIPSVSYSFKF